MKLLILATILGSSLIASAGEYTCNVHPADSKNAGAVPTIGVKTVTLVASQPGQTGGSYEEVYTKDAISYYIHETNTLDQSGAVNSRLVRVESVTSDFLKLRMSATGKAGEEIELADFMNDVAVNCLPTIYIK